MKSNVAIYVQNAILTNSFCRIFIIPTPWRKNCCSCAANHMSDSRQGKPKRKKHKLLPIYHTFSWLDEMMNQNENNTNETSTDYVFVRYIEEFTSNI